MPQMLVQQAIQLAMQHIGSGDFSQADHILRQILVAHPDHADALHLLGMLAFQSQQFESALQIMLRSIQINPHQAGYYCNVGQVLSAMGRIDEAIQANQQALSLAPDLPEANNNLANLLQSQGRTDEAIACYRKVLAARADLPQVWMNLALALHARGELPAAIEAYQRLLALTPHDPAALNNLANALQQSGQIEPAIELYRHALAGRSNYSEAHNNLGQALARLRRNDEAIAEFQIATSQRPDYAEAHRALGNVLREVDRIDESIAANRRAAELQPDSAEIQSDLGNALRQAGQFEPAIACYRWAIQIKPDYAIAHFNLGLNLLQIGQLHEGWIEHEWRWRVPEARLWQPLLSQPKWTGEDLNGRTILLHAEQGFGDSIQFARYIPQVTVRGGRINLYCQPELIGLFSQIPGINRIVAPPEMPAHDMQCALMSLPGVFDTNLETIPRNVPYIIVDAKLSARWRERIPKDDRKNIGLIWSGRQNPDPRRSMPLSALTPLGKCTGARFFSLQVGDAARELASAPPGLDITDLSHDLTDLTQTAAAMDHLDLIITIDTVTAHLAGALGRPVWTLLPFISDWRWLLDRTDSPWYPTMRLLRQSRAGDWQTPVEQMVKLLTEMSDTR